MDIVTQGLLGAVAGQATYGHRIGRKAAIIGGIAGVLPDIDVLFGYFTNPFIGMLMHRGFTHSLWFPFLLGPMLGLVYWRWQQNRSKKNLSMTGCIGAAVWGMMTHGLLDAFTSYGTQLLAPFSDYRFAFNAVSIIDILYTSLLLIGLGLAFYFLKHSQAIAQYCIVITTSYLCFGVLINQTMTSEIQQKTDPSKRVWVTPTIMQPFYRRVVLHDHNEVCVGYQHFMYPEDDIKYRCRERSKDSRIQKIKSSKKGKLFQWFADDLLFEWIQDKQDGSSIAIIGDIRLGLSLDPQDPLWGIFAYFDKNNKQISEIERFRNLHDPKTLWHTANSHFFKGYFYPQMKAYGFLD